MDIRVTGGQLIQAQNVNGKYILIGSKIYSVSGLKYERRKVGRKGREAIFITDIDFQSWCPDRKGWFTMLEFAAAGILRNEDLEKCRKDLVYLMRQVNHIQKEKKNEESNKHGEGSD
jgi:hypothetical protein